MRRGKFDPCLLIATLEEDGASRADIARETGLARSTITRLARGDIRRPSYDAVMRIERAGVTLRTRNAKGFKA
jgi:transcriptional regulator with XRE-family HTH domain